MSFLGIGRSIGGGFGSGGYGLIMRGLAILIVRVLCFFYDQLQGVSGVEGMIW
jgi:hypothetical protein